MTRFRIDPARSRVWTESRSSVHPIHGEADGLQGEIDVQVRDGRLDLSVAPRIRLELDVERLKSGNAFYDREMLRRIAARRFPTIVGDVKEMREMDSSHRYQVGGELNFHGVTHAEHGEVSVEVKDGTTLVIDGERTFDVRDFDVEPPKLLMLRVHPDVTVRVQVVAEVET